MVGPPLRLDQLVRAYRIARGVTQAELAGMIVPPVSRSLIAHVEQGIRIPPPDVLSRLCSGLGIPEALWGHYRARGFAGTSGRSIPHQGVPRLISVAGIMGSGKSTLARALASTLGFAYLPESSHGVKYLTDLARDRSRWAFETQLAFLATKALQIMEVRALGRSIILDRDLSEDVGVFARLFHEQGSIEERAFATYTVLAEHFMREVPSPDLVIFCRCSLEESIRRVQQRNRGDHLHTPEHMQEVFELYKLWASEEHGVATIELDSEVRDFRNPIVVAEIASEVRARLSSGTQEQLDLFGPPQVTGPISMAPRAGRSRSRALGIHPVMYLAAPFSGVATAAPATANPSLFADQHGVISKQYRARLSAIERRFRSWRIRTIIPHRDVNRWGKTQLTPEAAARQCTQHVVGCDGVVALLGTSHGAHYELGIAVGLGKPCIIVRCDELSESFIGSGINDACAPCVMTVRCRRLQDIPRALNHPDVKKFLARYMPLIEGEEGEGDNDD